MIAGVAYAVGAPCPTVLLDLTTLPTEPRALAARLVDVRARLTATGFGGVLKFALAAPSSHHDADLDYRFVQALPEALDRFDFCGSCGHSILAAVTIAAHVGWIPPLDGQGKVRVRLLDQGHWVLCRGVPAGEERWRFDAEFVNRPAAPLPGLLMTGRPIDTVFHAGTGHPVSLVSMGNPYAFVDTASLGLDGRDALFSADDGVKRHLLGIRRAAAELVGWPAASTFPKVAAVGATTAGRLYVRAVSVPSWHPTLALTGASCLAAATAIPGTIPNRLARRDGPSDDLITVVTPGGTTSVATVVRHRSPDGELKSVSIGGKEVDLLSSPVINDLKLTALNR